VVKLLIADDEPLVCVGLRSMLKWEDYGIEIAGTARNGQQAAEMIESRRPDIVITDIKMPLKTGLELAEECAGKYGKLPLFIILTSFEEFDFVRRAIGVQAVDYLVKLELTPESLGASITKALTALDLIRKTEGSALSVSGGTIQGLREKFFIRLYNNLFETREQYLAQKEDLGINFSTPALTVLSAEIERPENNALGDDKLHALYASGIRMAEEMLEKAYTCYITLLDTRHFTVIFCLETTDSAAQRKSLEGELTKIITIVHNYFNVWIRMAVGAAVEDPFRLDESYLSARRAFRETSPERPLCFFEASPGGQGEEFAFARFRPGIRRAFEELDTSALREVLTEIAAHFKDRPDLRVEAMDAACNILYMAISLLPGGEEMISRIFAEDPESYRNIYRMFSTEAIMEWLLQFRDGCCDMLSSQRQNYKQKVIANVQDYIQHNLGKRLSLGEVAAVFNFSPNYLSQLFTRYAGTGFVEYITAARIAAAKEMLARGEGPIYEIAEKLGYENAFYFSKVFKKEEGISPREFSRKLTEGEAPHSGPAGTPHTAGSPYGK
jgi:two-component system response regulator YesN